MTLADIDYGTKFMTDGLSEVLVKKRSFNKEYCIVGLPGVYDEFAMPLDTEIVAE